MTALYIFFLVLGAGLLLFSLAGDVLDHGDATLGDPGHADALHFLSLRTLTYFAFGFGGVGSALGWAWGGENALLTALLALGAGSGVAGAAHATFAYLRRTESGDRSGDQAFVGLEGKVSLPLSRDRAGKVVVRRGDRTVELVARPFEQAESSPETWRSVVIVEMKGATALVVPMDERLPG